LMEKKPINIADYESLAKTKLPKATYEYFKGPADDGCSSKSNQSKFRKIMIKPRVLRSQVKFINMETTVLGTKIKCPLMIAPMGTQKLAHDQGEIAMGKAAHNIGTIMCISAMSNFTFEQITSAVPTSAYGGFWFQLYVFSDKALTESFIKRAEKCGCKALVVTVDTAVLGNRELDKRNTFSYGDNYPGNFLGQFEKLRKTRGLTNGSEVQLMLQELFDNSIRWEDIAWLKTITKLPIVLKGILSPHDAVKAVKCGVSAIVVSNHGGRQLDTVPATIQCLPAIVEAVKDTGIEVHFDGGIQRGTDIFKALALGAKCVWIGRAAIWALAVNGEQSTQDAINILLSEFSAAMALSGCCSLDEITHHLVDDSLIKITPMAKL